MHLPIILLLNLICFTVTQNSHHFAFNALEEDCREPKSEVVQKPLLWIRPLIHSKNV